MRTLILKYGKKVFAIIMVLAFTTVLICSCSSSKKTGGKKMNATGKMTW